MIDQIDVYRSDRLLRESSLLMRADVVRMADGIRDSMKVWRDSQEARFVEGLADLVLGAADQPMPFEMRAINEYMVEFNQIVMAMNGAVSDFLRRPLGL